jgi:transposase
VAVGTLRRRPHQRRPAAGQLGACRPVPLRGRLCRLAGASPIPASSGKVTRHRLNRGGDRQLNQALHTIALVRLRGDLETRAYATRRTAEGKSPRDVKRCLKRIIARQLFRLLERYDQPGVEILRAA